MDYAVMTACTSFSMLEGASTPEELVVAASVEGVDHLVVADRDGVYGLARAHKAARQLPAERAVHLVLGATFTVAERAAITLLVRNRAGWAALCRLLTDARRHEVKGYGCVAVERLVHEPEGLTALFRPGWSAEQARPVAAAFEGRAGVLQIRTAGPDDARRDAWAHGLASALALPRVASNDVHFHVRERRPLADVLTCIRRGVTLEAAGRWLEPNAERHLLPRDVFADRFADAPEAVQAAAQLASECTFTLDELHYRYPHEVVPEGWTPMSWLRHRVRQGAAERWPAGLPESVQRQLEHELALIERLDFPSYFLTVDDIVRHARGRGILCQGRGSAANSAVCFALGITAVDPTQSQLLFERFISEERGEPPDIDVDFEHERREEVIQYIYGRYGRHRAAMVNAVITYRSRSAIRDVGKVFGLSLDQVGRLAKAMDRWSAVGEVEPEELVREAGLDPDDPAVRATLRMAEELRGFPRHLSIHSGGFTITEGALDGLVPIEPATMQGRTVIQWDKDDIDALGFIKIDVLALGMLTAIRKAFDFVKRHGGRELSLATVPREDPAVYEMFCRADTVGVFQIESRAQMSMLPRLKPRCFYDLVVEVAIVRPGPIQGGMVHPYLRRRSGQEPVTYPHPALEPILERTLGVPLFQEQVMKMAVEVGGFTPGEADALRRAMAAWRKKGSMDGMGRKLVQGMLDRGLSPAFAEAIFQQIQGFGEYGFPESHAASFALLVYVSGWIKCHHPAAFTAALINSQPLGFYSNRALVADAQRHDVLVRPVCLVSSAWDCTLEADAASHGGLAIRLGLRLVKGLAEASAERIVAVRGEAAFRDVADVAHRTGLHRDELEALAEADAFRALGVDRREAAWILQGLWTGLPLFAGLPRRAEGVELPRESAAERVGAAYRRVGLSVDEHPIGLHRPALERAGVRRLVEVQDLPNGERVRLAGLVSNRQRPGTSRGVVFMTLEDEAAMINLVVWPKVWTEHRKLARTAVLLGIDGLVQRQDDAISVLVERFWPLDAIEHLQLASQSRDFR